MTRPGLATEAERVYRFDIIETTALGGTMRSVDSDTEIDFGGRKFFVSVVSCGAKWAAVIHGDIIIVRDTGDHEINLAVARQIAMS